MVEGFSEAHLEFIQHLKPQLVEHDYIVPLKNFDELHRILSHLSCGARKLSNEEYGYFGARNLYSTLRFCKFCPVEDLPTLYAGTSSEGLGAFIGFPKEIYQITTSIGVEFGKAEEMLRAYLNTWHKILENKSLELLSDSENEHFPTRSIANNSPINEMFFSFWDLLFDLEEVVKKKEEHPHGDKYKYKFKICSDHNNEDSLSQLRPIYIEMTRGRFKKYDLALQEGDIEIIFSKKKIFSLD